MNRPEKHPNGNPIRVFLAEDHELMRMGVRLVFRDTEGFELVGEAANFTETLASVRRLAPDVVLLDLSLHEGDILHRIPELLTSPPAPKVLVFSDSSNSDTHLNALRLGAVGIFSKGQSAESLLKAVKLVRQGELWINRQIAATMFYDFHRANHPPAVSDMRDKSSLTARERDIAKLAAKGFPAKRVAQQLGISAKTVRNQLVAVYSKLDVANQLELATKAVQLGLTSELTRSPPQPG